MPAPKSTGCQSYRNLPVNDRRNFIKAGALSTLGITLSTALRQEARAATPSTAKAKSVILFWLQGGVSHHDTLDPKPDAPVDVRGEFSPIATRLPGVHFSDEMPRLASLADKLAVIRSVRHSEGAHQRGSMYMVEGRRPPRETGVNHSGNPELGCIVAHELGMQNGMPAFCSIPGNDFTSRFTGHGWLPANAGPFRGTQAKALEPGGQTPKRFTNRDALRDALSNAAITGKNITSNAWDEFDQQAVDIVASGRGAEAFDHASEPEEIKAIYKHHGRQARTARRLIEAGVRYVTIGQNSWDYHSKIFPQLRRRLPQMDNSIGGLIVDLEQRGMLDETLVIYMTEYGRTPRVNKDAGRDHWPQAFSIAFAGAGIQGGQVLGATDSKGASVTDRPVSPEEIAATILHLTGINPHTAYSKPDGRPIHYVDNEAQPIREILA